MSGNSGRLTGPNIKLQERSHESRKMDDADYQINKKLVRKNYSVSK